MLKITKNSTNNSPKILNSESMKTLLTEPNSLNSLDIIPLNLVKNWFPSKNMFQEWKKDKKIFTSLLENLEPQLPTLPSLNNSKKEDMKSSTWLIPSMNTSFNN